MANQEKLKQFINENIFKKGRMVDQSFAGGRSKHNATILLVYYISINNLEPATTLAASSQSTNHGIYSRDQKRIKDDLYIEEEMLHLVR